MKNIHTQFSFRKKTIASCNARHCQSTEIRLTKKTVKQETTELYVIMKIHSVNIMALSPYLTHAHHHLPERKIHDVKYTEKLHFHKNNTGRELELATNL